jgi:hypothetical protein
MARLILGPVSTPAWRLHEGLSEARRRPTWTSAATLETRPTKSMFFYSFIAALVGLPSNPAIA